MNANAVNAGTERERRGCTRDRGRACCGLAGRGGWGALPMKVVAGIALWASPAMGLINPTLQPDDLYQRYRRVMVCEVMDVDARAHALQVREASLLKAPPDQKSAGAAWKITARGKGVDAFRQSLEDGHLAKGTHLVAFIDEAGRGGKGKVLLYAGAWGIGKVADDGAWHWTSGDERMIGSDGKPVPAMAGVWNGSTPRLVELLRDIRDGRAFFPRKAYARFRDDILVDEFGRSLGGVGLVDFDGDGDLDLYSCSDAGDRMYLQMQPMVFVNATEYLGMDHASLCCSFADVDGDGRPDLLADGAIYANRLVEDKPRLEETSWLPGEANDDVKAAAFVELNGDGWPDVLLTNGSGGLQAWLHNGNVDKAGRPLGDATDKPRYRSVTRALGLDRADAGAKQAGYFTVGDWNNDGRADIFFAVGKGILLVQQKDGQFRPLKHDLEMSFKSGEEGEEGLTGAGCFVDIVGDARLDLVVPVESGWHVIQNGDGSPVDVTAWGNEISEGSYLHLATVAADLNLDGCVDFYTIARGDNGQNRFIINRGYGSFMLASVNRAYDRMFQGAAHQRGGTGLAVGDVDGDGQPDLLIGNERGELLISCNDTLARRERSGRLLRDEQVLARVQLVGVDLGQQRGVVGADVRLIDPERRVVARRYVGANTATGSQSSRAFTIAVRQPGRYVLETRFADAHVSRDEVELSSGKFTSKAMVVKPGR